MSGDCVVAIDGPSGSGKSTVARGVGEALGLRVLDTGAMYRAVTLAALEAAIDLTDGDAVGALARDLQIELETSVLLDGRDVSSEIRTPEVTAVGLDGVGAPAGAPGARGTPAEVGRRARRRRGRGT